MAEQELSLRVKVLDDGSIVLKGFGAVVKELGTAAEVAGAKHKTAWDGAKKALSGIAGQFTAANLATRAINWGYDSIINATAQLFILGDALDEVEGSFERLASAGGFNAARMLQGMQQASEGLVPKIDLMRTANELLASGLPVTEQSMAQLTAGAKALGEAHGVDAAQGLKMLADGLVRGQDRALQLLGVDVDLAAITKQLGADASESAKKHAVYEAVMLKLAEASGKVSGGQASVYDSFQQAKIAVADWWGEVGQAINHSDALNTSLASLATSGKWLVGVLGNVAAGIGWMVNKFLELNPVLKEGIEMLGGGGQALKDMGRDIEGAKRTTAEIRALGEVLKGTGISIKDVTEKYGSHGAALMALSRGGGAYPQLQDAAKAALDKLRESKQVVTEASGAHTELGRQSAALAAEIAKLDKEYAGLTTTEKTLIKSSLDHKISVADIAKQMGLAEETVSRYATALGESGKAAEEAAKKFDDALLKSIEQSGTALADLGDEFKKLPQVSVPALDATTQAALDAGTAANDLAAAYAAFGLKSAADVKKAADEMVKNYDVLKASGTATASGLQSAWQQVYDFYTQNNLALPDGWKSAMSRIETTTQAAAERVIDIWGTLYGAMDQIASIIGGGASKIVNTVIGIAESAKSVFSGIVFGAGKELYNGMAGLIQGISGFLDQFTQKAVAIGSQIGSTIGSFFGPLGQAIGNFVGSIGGAIVGLFKKLFGQRSPEQAAIEEMAKHFGASIGMETAKEITAAISAAFGGISGESLEDKIPIGIYLPEVQLILIREQLAALSTETAEYWATTWTNSTRAVLINDLGKTEAEAAAAMKDMIQTALDALKASGQQVGPVLADLVAWATKLGVEFNTVGIEVKTATGEVMKLNEYLTRAAGVEIFTAKFKAGLEDVKKAMEDILDAKHMESRIKQVGDVLSAFFRTQIQALQQMIKEGLSPEQVAAIGAQLLPQLKEIAQYQLTTLQSLKDSGAGTTQIWNLVGESMARQLKLMRDLGLENTAIYEKMQQEYKELKNNAQTIAGITGPLVTFFQKLGETGELTSKNFEQWAGTALSYLNRLQAAGATSAEIWQAISGIFEVFKQKHDEVFSSLQEKMNNLFTNNATLTDAMKTAIQDYVLNAKGSLADLAAMGVPQSLLDQIQKWRELAGEVDGPVYDALQKFYEQQKELQKWTGLMDQVNALFIAMGDNIIDNNASLEEQAEQLTTWSDTIHKYVKQMLEGGMSLQQITAQYGGSLHQLYLEYQAQGRDVPKWLRDIEKEYQRQEAAKRAADEAQRQAQIAMLEAFRALIEALGGDVPDAIQDAIDALNDLQDSMNTVTGSTHDLTDPVDALRTQVDDTTTRTDAMRTAFNDAKTAIEDTTKEGGSFYKQMHEWLTKLTTETDTFRKAFKGSGVHKAIVDTTAAGDVFRRRLSDALDDTRKKTEDNEKRMEKLKEKIEKVTGAANAMKDVMSIGVNLGNITEQNVGQYEQQALQFIGAMKATGAGFSSIFETVKGYSESLGPLGATQITALFDLLAKAAPFLSQLDPLKSAIESLGGSKIKRGSFDTIASTLMSIYTQAAAVLGAGDTTAYMKSTLATLKDVNKGWRTDVGGFAALMSAAGYKEGLPYVPFDYFPAWLHKGEGVFPEVVNPFTSSGTIKPEFTRLRDEMRPAGGDGAAMPGGGQVTINVTIQAIDTQSMEDAVRRDLIPILNRAIQNNTGGLKTYIQQT